MKSKFPELSQYLRNGNVEKSKDKSIGIFLGSDNRSNGNLAIGGVECTIIRMLPVNINIRWGENQKVFDDEAVRIYNTLLQEVVNFEFNGIKIACIQMLDGCPISLGRDDKNICEAVIRANFYYYV
jgi:hypothetical protein